MAPSIFIITNLKVSMLDIQYVILVLTVICVITIYNGIIKFFYINRKIQYQV